MRTIYLLAALPLLAACGCVMYPTGYDSDVKLYATAFEMPRLEQQPMILEFSGEGVANRVELGREALRIILGSGKFRLPRPGEKPAVTIELTAREVRRTYHGRVVAAAFVLWLVPVTTDEYVIHLYANVRRAGPPFKLVEHCYAQGRGKKEFWLGYIVWPGWVWNDDRLATIKTAALKAITVKICRALMPRTER